MPERIPTGKVIRKAGTRAFGPKEDRDRKLVEGWKKAYQDGIAGDLCDVIVRERPAPPALLAAIFTAPTLSPYFDLGHGARRPKYGRDGSPARKPTLKHLKVIRLYADGKSMVEIEKKLFLSRSTVTSRTQRAYERTGAKSLPHLVAICLREGWIA